MDPATMMAAATAFKAIGSLVSGYSEAAGIEGQANAAGYNSRLARQNAEIASSQADAREEQMRRDARQAQGAQRAAVAEGGSGYGGSNLDVLRQDAMLAELDALNTRYAGAVERTGFENEAAAQNYQRKALKKAAGRSKINAWMTAGAQLLGGTGSYVPGGSAAAHQGVSARAVG